MRAMVLEEQGRPLVLREIETPRPGPHEILVKVSACGVCRTDLHVLDGDLREPKLPLVLGHEIVGTVAELGAEVDGYDLGARVGVPWLGKTCGRCPFCQRDEENLCDEPSFTGYLIDGGYAEYAVADAQFCFPVHGDYSDVEAAPLLCAGLIGFRSLRMAGDAERLGIYGFGAAAHIIAQVAHREGRDIYAFTRPGDDEGQQFARDLGAVWAGVSTTSPPVALDAALLFAPVGALVPAALAAVRKGGIVVCAGIHMSDIPTFPYSILWGERVVRSVANLTRADGEAFLRLAPQVPVRTQVQTFPLTDANRALEDLRAGRIQGAAVLTLA